MAVVESKPELNMSVAPRPIWPGGHMGVFARDRLGFMERTAREYGDIVRLDFNGYPVFLVSSPQVIEEVLVLKNRSFTKGRGLGRTRRILGNGLLTSEGEFWRRQRRLAQPAFHARRIEAYGEIMFELTQKMLANWQEGQVRDVHQDMMTLTLAIVARALFGFDIDGEGARRVRAALEVGLHHFNHQGRTFYLIPEWLPTPENLRFEKAARTLDEVVYEIIRQHRAQGTPSEDLLSMLLEARDEDGSQMTDTQVRDEVMTLFLAGHETTANALSWAWMLLAQNPEAEGRLHAELDAVLEGRPPRVSDLVNLPYTQNTITEVLRLYPPAYVIDRQAAEEVQIGHVILPAGSTVLMSQWVVQRDPRWYDEPERFRPERWEGDFSRRIPDFAYFPFGGGPRLCIGKPFALQEAALVLASVAQRYRLALEPGHKIAMQTSITLRPRRGIFVRLYAR